MELAPRYCRSCGSRLLVKNVCHNCNRDPLNGDNYCYDCGALTPNADRCFKCGAKYKRSSPSKLVVILGGLLIVVIAVAGYLLSRPNKQSTEPQQEKTIAQNPVTTDTNKQAAQVTHDTIVNKPVPETSAVIINKPKPVDSVATKPVVTDTAKKISPDIFSGEELKAYKIKCSYFEKNQKSQVYFFIAAGSGYIKVNGKVYELKRKRKGADLAVFAGDEYEATIVIDGLSGSSREWLASCTLSIKNLLQNTSVKHKVYSTCIEL